MLPPLLVSLVLFFAFDTDECGIYPPQAHSPYVLPYPVDAEHLVWRTTTHYTPGNRGVGLYAIDFEMPIGTSVAAARSGVVVAVRENFPDNNDKDLEENYVMVRHADSTVARYLHLTRNGAVVNFGDSVKEGQIIARSGNSGQSGGPHLHFDVQLCGPNLPPNYNQLPCGRTVPVSFRNTHPHACGLVPQERYRADAIAAPTQTWTAPSRAEYGVREALYHYLLGHTTGDSAHFHRAFHPQGNLYWVRDGQLMTRTAESYAAGASGRPAADEAQRSRKVTAIHITGDAASAIVELNYPAVQFVDYMSLVRVGDEWRIISKVYQARSKS
jgi:hypothetical protein